MLNVIQQATIERRLARVQEKLAEVELFLTGNPITAARIKDAAITSAKIDDLSITNAKFADVAITNAKITNVDAAKFDAGTISADRIGANSITATKLNVSTLSAISANMGTMTAGNLTGLTITGALLRSETSGARVEMTASPNALIVYDGSSNAKVRIDPDGLQLRDLGMNFIDGATFKAAVYTQTLPDEVNLEAGNCDELFVVNGKSGGDIQIVTASGTIFMTSDNFIKINGTTKTAIVPTTQGYNALYALEAPDVWFFDFAKDVDSIDPTFLEVTEGEQNVLETDQGEVLVFRKRKSTAGKRFANRTVEQFDRNNAFWGAV